MHQPFCLRLEALERKADELRRCAEGASVAWIRTGYLDLARHYDLLAQSARLIARASAQAPARQLPAPQPQALAA